MRRERLLGAGAVALGLALATVVPNLLAGTLGEASLVALSVGGGGLMFAGAVYDDAACRAERDERQAEIHYRSGYNALLALAAAVGILFTTMVNLDTAVGPLVLWAVLLSALPVYFGSVQYYRRVM
jgi:hypothetical protein